MFTGLVETVGTVRDFRRTGSVYLLWASAHGGDTAARRDPRARRAPAPDRTTCLPPTLTSQWIICIVGGVGGAGPPASTTTERRADDR